MERLSGMSFAVTEQISVKGGTLAPGYVYFNLHYLSRVYLNLCTRSLFLGSVCYFKYLVSSSTQYWVFQNPELPLWSSLLSYFCCLDEVLCS